MCSHCDQGDGVEITEETIPLLIHEVTTVAKHAASCHANGWVFGAKGLYLDMMRKWGPVGAVRLAYVWGSARFFLPAPDDAPALAPGYTVMAEEMRQGTGQEPDPHRIAGLVALSDQVATIVGAITTAASKGDLEELTDIVGAMSEDGNLSSAVMLALVAEAGMRMSHAVEVGDARAMELFEAHINADMPADPDDDDEQEE